MKYKFTIKKIPLTYEEKIERAEEYNYYEDENIDPKEFAKRDIYEEYIDFKCDKCGYEEVCEADIILECFVPEFEEYPVLICPKCNDGDFIPKDIYNQKHQKQTKK